MSSAALIARHELTLAIDYGQFWICGSGFAEEGSDTFELLTDALNAPPSSSDGRTVVVLSPHQNNFATAVTVETWSARPPVDTGDWEQVSEEPLVVGDDGIVRLGSPTLGTIECPASAGDQLVEVSGRGFVNYGWPGSTEPGDVWRLRLWPSLGDAPRPAVLWTLPGFGTYGERSA